MLMMSCMFWMRIGKWWHDRPSEHLFLKQIVFETIFLLTQSLRRIRKLTLTLTLPSTNLSYILFMKTGTHFVNKDPLASCLILNCALIQVILNLFATIIQLMVFAKKKWLKIFRYSRTMIGFATMLVLGTHYCS